MAAAARAESFGGPLPDLTPAQLAEFEAGRAKFTRTETVADGLGPVFNEASCVACHVGPGGAPGGGNGRLEHRFGRSANGVFDPLVAQGGSLQQDHAIGSVADGYVFVPEIVPPQANVVAGRRTTPLYGLGLVDAVPDSTFISLAQLQALITPATAGTVAWDDDLATGKKAVGKFGWKAQNPNLFQFAGDAYLNEMGVTNPQFPNENCPQGDCAALVHNPQPGLNDDGSDVLAFAQYMSRLAPPPAGPQTSGTARGQDVFRALGCSECHIPSLTSGDSPVQALSHVRFSPFSDFLLHDMGALGDGIAQGSAGPRMMRTAPLWGVRTQPRLLHDGRAGSLEEAIAGHDGQGAASRDGFSALGQGDRAALMEFLQSL